MSDELQSGGSSVVSGATAGREFTDAARLDFCGARHRATLPPGGGHPRENAFCQVGRGPGFLEGSTGPRAENARYHKKGIWEFCRGVDRAAAKVGRAKCQSARRFPSESRNGTRGLGIVCPAQVRQNSGLLSQNAPPTRARTKLATFAVLRTMARGRKTTPQVSAGKPSRSALR